MKAKRRIAWLLSFLMVFSLIMGTSKMQVFAVGGAGETATFEIRESNGQTGTVQYKLNGNGDFTTANNNTQVNLEGVTSITIKVIPTGEAKVNQNYSGISGTEQTFDYDALINESGWTYNIQDNDGNITFTIEFDNNDGTGGGSNPGGGGEPGENVAYYSVDFGTGSWRVGDVTVTADKTGEQTLSEGDIITLTDFDAETMEARVDAEDGFGTTLTVTDGQTSISAHTNEGGVPTDITFSVLAKPSSGSGGDNPQQPGPSIEFFADSSIEGGTLAVNNGIFTLSKDGSGLGTFRVTLVDSASQETAYAGNEERIPLNDISSVKIVMTPAEGMKAKLITGGDTPVGALSEPVFNDAGNTYTYTAYPGQFGGEQQFLAVSVWFGESEDDLNQVDFTAVIWDGDQVENKSEHGSITVSSVVIGSTTYTYKGNGRFENNNTETDLIEWYGYNKTSINEEAGVRIMDAAFDDPNTEVYINFVFKPDYGYQVTGIGTNESTTSLASAGFSASETISTFRFKVIQHNNPHFAVAFTATEDIVKANAASISEGGVELAAGELDGGSAVLEVNEANITNQGDFEAAAEGYVVSEYLDISLYNVFYKENADNVWSSPIENLSRPAEITLKLQEAIDTDTVKIVHEKGDGEFELLDADYDPETKEITFSTSSFSNYAIAYEESGNEQTQDRYLIDFTNAPWTVDGVEVDLEGREPGAELMVWITTEDVIPLTNFDLDTMDAVLIVDENVTLRLNVDENGNTRLADVDGGVEVLPPYGETLTFAVVAKPGNMEIVDKIEENACNADLAELTDDLISNLLTDAEKTRLENGEEVKVWIEATDISATVSQTDKDLIDSKKGNTTIGMYFDIDLLKQIGSDSPVNITDTDGAVTITLKVPSSLINSNSSVTRTYQMIRVHNGVATVIPCTYNAANQTISCETDQFSTYALAYVDQQNNSGSGNTGDGNTDGGNAGGGSNDNVKDVVPKPGDASNAYVWFMLALVSGIGALYFGKKGLVLKKEN